MNEWMRFCFLKHCTHLQFTSIPSTCMHTSTPRLVQILHSNIAQVHTNAVSQNLGSTFHYYFCKYLDSILFPRKARWLISEKECYLFLTHNITICTNIFRHFIYVFQHLKFSKTCFSHFLQHSFKNRRSFV